MGRVVVLGSANADLVVAVPRRPGGGETLLGSDLQLFPGGKGANQAAAAARSGARVRFLGCVGHDAHGEFLLEHLATAGVDVVDVERTDRPTGTALILLTPDGENSIVVSPGANHAVDQVQAERWANTWMQAQVLVVSLEIPLATACHLVKRAARAGVRVVLNVAPAQPIKHEVLACCDPLVVNEHEARTVLGDQLGSEVSDFRQVAAALLAGGARSVVITLGAAGAVVGEGHTVTHVPAYQVDPVDTTGAGDAFVGGLAAELARGAKLPAAVGFATALAALAVGRMGAQSSYVDRAEVLAFMDRHR